MTKPDRFESVVADATPGVEATSVTTSKAAAKLELDGDEIVQLSIKPSLWFIPLVSFKWVLAMALAGAVLAVALRGGWTREGFIAFQVVVGVAVLRVAVAALQWASRLYVLTNRRVMRFMGVLNVDVVECPLAKISRADLKVAWYQHLLRLGTIHMSPAASKATVIVWEQLAHSAEIHERLLRAIRKAQSKE
ncbi:MAG: PH domain-containing protein [Phycisphaerae bacterium]|nr:PH domain-containing protein [Phycisphaerae bacterium]